MLIPNVWRGHPWLAASGRAINPLPLCRAAGALFQVCALEQELIKGLARHVHKWQILHATTQECMQIAKSYLILCVILQLLEKV